MATPLTPVYVDGRLSSMSDEQLQEMSIEERNTWLDEFEQACWQALEHDRIEAYAEHKLDYEKAGLI